MAGNPPGGDRKTEALANELVERLLEKYTAPRRSRTNAAPLTAEQFLQEYDALRSNNVIAVPLTAEQRRSIQERLGDVNRPPPQATHGYTLRPRPQRHPRHGHGHPSGASSSRSQAGVPSGRRPSGASSSRSQAGDPSGVESFLARFRRVLPNNNTPDSVLISAVSAIEKRRDLISDLPADLNAKHKGTRSGKRVKRQGGWGCDKDKQKGTGSERLLPKPFSFEESLKDLRKFGDDLLVELRREGDEMIEGMIGRLMAELPGGRLKSAKQIGSPLPSAENRFPTKEDAPLCTEDEEQAINLRLTENTAALQLTEPETDEQLAIHALLGLEMQQSNQEQEDGEIDPSSNPPME